MKHGRRFGLRHVDDHLEGYVLGALDGDQQRAVKRHLIICRRCRHLADGLAAVVAHLAFAPLLRQPPPELKTRVLAAVHSANRPSGVRSFPNAATSGRRVTPAWVLAAAAPWVLVAVLGAAWWMARTPARQPSVLSTVTLSGPSGILGVLTADEGAPKGALVLTHLASFPLGKTFVCWVVRAGRVERVCTFHLQPHQDDAVVVLTFVHPWTNDAAIGISAESAPLPSQPSGTFLATTQRR